MSCCPRTTIRHSVVVTDGPLQYAGEARALGGYDLTEVGKLVWASQG